MKALRLRAIGEVSLDEISELDDPQSDEAQVAIDHMALNHFDLWGIRGMAFARRNFPITIGVEVTGKVRKVGAACSEQLAGKRVVVYPGDFCSMCEQCVAGSEHQCQNSSQLSGFHRDGFCQEYLNVKEKNLILVPDGVSAEHAACITVTAATVHHMLVNNARLHCGESILVHAAGSGIGSLAIAMSKAIGARVIATAGSDEKVSRAEQIGADFAVNYRKERFSRFVRKITNKKGVDVVFEHVGPDTWEMSLSSLSNGGRLVTCGSTTGTSANTDIGNLFRKNIGIFGSFGSPLSSSRESLKDISAGKYTPVLDSILSWRQINSAIEKMETRNLFGKIVIRLD